MKKKILSILLTLAIMLSIFPSTVFAVDSDGQPQTITVTETVPVDADDLPDNDELFAGYVQKVLYGDYGISLIGNYGETFFKEGSNNLQIYRL